MKNSLVFASLALAGLAGAASAQPLLYGVGNFGNPFQPMSLYQINTATGAATLVGNTGLAQISGITWDAASSTLYAFTASADLYVLNGGNGQATLIRSSANVLPEGDVTVGPAGFSVINGTSIASFNTLTGAITNTIDMSAVGTDLSGLVTDGTNFAVLALNGSAPDTIGLTNFGFFAGAIPLPTNGTTVGALAISADGSQVFISDGSTLHALSVSGLSVSTIGSFGVAGMSGLAVIPTPSVAGAMGLLALAGLRRRR
jgi:hypothetical protein